MQRSFITYSLLCIAENTPRPSPPPPLHPPKKFAWEQLSELFCHFSFTLLINNLKSFVIHNFKGHNISLSRCAPLLSFLYVWIIAWFIVIFRMNTTSDISKLLHVISRAVRRVKFQDNEMSRVVFMPNITYKSCYYLLYYYPQKVCNFHM